MTSACRTVVLCSKNVYPHNRFLATLLDACLCVSIVCIICRVYCSLTFLIFIFVEMQFCTPCIRAMVVESPSIAESSLFIITCTGGTVGREADLGHAILIPDPAVSKVTADFDSLSKHTVFGQMLVGPCINYRMQ